MKADLFSIEGKKLKEIELPRIFSSKVREDIIKKAYEIEKTELPYGPNPMSGRKHSASGIIRHLRHVWKSGYGKGTSRIPRKIMWRRGTQFYWVGSEISSTRGGRRAHPPKIASRLKEKRINKKEFEIAFKGLIASTVIPEKTKKRYSSLAEKNIIKLPLVIESKSSEVKTKDLVKLIKLLTGEAFEVAIPKKEVRAGKGKLRNRKYKKSRGVLIITGNEEELKTSAVEVVRLSDLLVSDLYPTGRIVIYTEKAINDLGNKNDN